MTEEIETARGAISSRLITGITATVGVCVATTEPATEQSGQRCDAKSTELTSVQKWNCAPSKIAARSKAKARTR